jgi:hypothetical protein
MRRPWLAAASAVVGLGVAAAQAYGLAEVSVNAETRALEVEVVGVAGADGNHGLAIRPGFDTVRVEQLQFGDPSISSPGVQVLPHRRCDDINLIANTVTCPLFPASMTIHTGDGADRVRIGPSDPLPSAGGTSADTCFAPSGTQAPGVPVSAILGPGDDTLSVVPNDPNDFEIASIFCTPGLVSHTDAYDPIVTANGGSGNDDLRAPGPRVATLSGDTGRDVVGGGDGADVLRGGADADRVNGGPGDDVIAGDDGADDLAGSFGNDQIVGGAGDDLEKGDDGSDTFSDVTGQPDGADRINGGAGFDTVDLSRRTGDLDVHVDSDAGDGEAGEGDQLVSIERVLGGRGDDVIVGASSDDTLVGGEGRDRMSGGGGADDIDLGPGDDSVVAVDGIRDEITCGPGTDRADLDLQDVVHQVLNRAAPGRGFVPDCESIARHARDDSPPGAVTGRRLTIAGGRARVAFTCPRVSRPGCRGTLTVRDGARPGRVLGTARYAFRRGAGGVVAVRLRPGAARALHRSRRAVVRTVERGHSRLGPRGVEIRLRVAA